MVASEQTRDAGATSGGASPSHEELERRLVAFLSWWLGEWPPKTAFSVAASYERARPGWDGKVAPVIGVASPDGTVLSVPPGAVEATEALFAGGPEAVALGIGRLVGRPAARLVRGVFRWSEALVDLPDAGEWVPNDDPRLPEWLRPFNGDVLVAFDDEGKYAAGVGCKIHGPLGTEFGVGTEPAHRGEGLARRLVAQASRRVVGEGAIALYMHNPTNFASAAVAEAAGFPDRGWQVIELAFGESVDDVTAPDPESDRGEGKTA